MGYIGAGITRFNTADELTVTGDARIDTTTLVVDSTNNRVGVGTASPATALDVTGTVTADGLTVDGDTASNGNLTITTSSNTMLDLVDTSASFRPSIRFMKDDGGVAQLHMLRDDGGELDVKRGTSSLNQARFGSNGDVSLYADDGTTQGLFWDASTQRLGLGTTSPIRTLEVTDGTSGKIRASGTDGGFIECWDGTNGVYFGTAPAIIGSGNSKDSILWTEAGGDQLYYTSGVERMRIDSSGNVGIGTSSPSGTLDVKGPVYVSGSTSGSTKGISANSTATEVWHYVGSNGAMFRAYDDSANFMHISATGNVVLNNAKYLQFKDSGGTARDVLAIDGFNGLNINSAGGGAAAPIVFKENGSEIARFDTSGNLGIGTSSPGANLEVSSANPNIDVSDTGTSYASQDFLTNSDAVRATIGVERSSGGGLFVGSSAYAAVFGTASSGSTQFATNNNVRMTIDSNGQVMINQTSSPVSGPYYLSVYSADNVNAAFEASGTASHTQVRFINPNGIVGTIVTNASATSYNTSSDYRLKENVTADWDATTRLKQLNPVRFNFIADADTTVDGFLAHEVQSVVPEAITGTKDAVDADGNPVYQGIDQSKLVPLLVKTIQELEARIAALEAN